MNFKTFAVATTTIFPITNSKAGGQLVTEWNLRSREMVTTDSEITYDVGPSYAHGMQDYYVDKHVDGAGVVINSSTLAISAGRALVNGHYVKQEAQMLIDLQAANNELLNYGKMPLKGKLAVGLRAYYSTETTMIGSMEPEDAEDGVFVGVQVVVLPEIELKTPEDSPHDRNKVNCHLKLATFQFLDNEILGVIQNPNKCAWLGADRIKDIEDLIGNLALSNKGIQPKKLYALAGKGFSKSKEVVNNTWCDATDSLFKWDPNPTIVKDPPKHNSATFEANSDNSKVILSLPHKPVDGMDTTLLEEGGKARAVREYYKEAALELPAADYIHNTAGTVSYDYTRNIKNINDRVTKSFQIMKGKQVAYIDLLNPVSSNDEKDLPKEINDEWNAGDYVLVNRDARALAESGQSGTVREPSTFYAVLPGKVKNLEFYAVVENSDKLPRYRTNDVLGNIVSIGEESPLKGVQLGNTVLRTKDEGAPPTTRSVTTLSDDVEVGVSVGQTDVTPGTVEYITNEGIIYDDINSASLETDSSIGYLEYSSKNPADERNLALNAILSNSYAANKSVEIKETSVTFGGQRIVAYTISIDGMFLHISEDRPYQAYFKAGRTENDLFSCFFILDPDSESMVEGLDSLHPQPVVDVTYDTRSRVVVHGLNYDGNLVVLKEPYSYSVEATNPTMVIPWDERALDKYKDILNDWSYSVIDENTYDASAPANDMDMLKKIELKKRINMSRKEIDNDAADMYANNSDNKTTNVMIYYVDENNHLTSKDNHGLKLEGEKYAVAALSFGDMQAYFTTSSGIDIRNMERLFSNIPNANDRDHALAKEIKNTISSMNEVASLRGVEFATAALFFNELNASGGLAQSASSFNRDLVNKGLPGDSNAVLKEIYAYCYRLSAIGPGTGEISNIDEDSSIFIYARPNTKYAGMDAQRQLWQLLEQDKNILLANSYYGSCMASETADMLRNTVYQINYETGIITGIDELGTATYSYTSKDVHEELMAMFNVDDDNVRGVTGEDYFVCRYDLGNGRYAMYYYVVTLEGKRMWSDAVWLTGPTYLATEEVVGGFLNVPESALDAGYVYMNDQGHLQLLDYGLLRSGLAAYQLGQNINITGGLATEDIQTYLDEYVNERIAFPNQARYDEIQEAIDSGTTTDNVYLDPNVIHISINLAEEKTPVTLRLHNIDCRFGTSIFLHLNGNANSNTTIIIDNVEKIRIDDSIFYDENDMPVMQLKNCGLYYSTQSLNMISLSNGLAEVKKLKEAGMDVMDPLKLPTGISGLRLWYDRWDSGQADISADGLTVTVNNTPVIPVILDFWNTSAPNDNRFKIALKSITFSSDGIITGCSLYIANDSTSNVAEGDYIIGGDFEIPQGLGLSYPKYCMRHQIKVTGTFESGYSMGNNEYMMQTTNFSAITNTHSIYSTSSTIKGQLLVHVTAKVISALFDDAELSAWSPDKYHVFPGSSVSEGA